MSIQVEGTIERKAVGTGTWALVSKDGVTYELHNPPADLKQSGLSVVVEGQVRDDIMTIAMIGPVLEVKSFNVVK
jgi:hypothetical protein